MEQQPAQLKALKSYLSEKGLKSTKQREAVVETFLNTREHIDIESLYQKVKRKYPKIGYATVYRTMKVLKDSGIASERHFGTKHAVYELHIPDQHHDHLICLKCNHIIEFENQRIEKLQDEIAKKYRFRLETHKHELYGYCADCRSR